MSKPIVVTGAVRIAERLKSAGVSMKSGIETGLRQGAELTKSHMQDKYLSGNPLRVRTNKLRGGWTAPIVKTSTPSETVVAFGTNTVYAAVHEFGFNGIVQVKSHPRTSRSGKIHQVLAHPRHMRVTAKHYVRRSIEDTKTKVANLVRLRVKQALGSTTE